ncbi:MAG: AMP-binding protein [Gammaproteobacteria bacterium]
MTAPQESPWVDGLTIGRVLADTARKFPKREALVFPQTGTRMNYTEFAGGVRGVAKGLLAMDIKPGEHVGIWATNLPEWTLLQYGAASIGVVLVTINPAYRPFELRYTLDQSDVVALFLTDKFKSSDYYAIFKEACPEMAQAHEGKLSCASFPKLRSAVAIKPNAPAGYLAWNSMIEAGRKIDDSELEAIAKKLKARDVINIQYTSGTTGFPKAAMLTHHNVLMNAWYVTDCQNISERDRMCVPVPFYHCFGCVMGSLGAVTRGSAMIVPAEHFNPTTTLETIEQESCTTIYGVPTMFVALLADASLKRRNLSSLRSGIMAGSPCPIEVMKKVIDDMGCSEITIAYGQTETSPVVTQSHVDDSIELRVATAGRALPGVELKIVSCETGRRLPDDEQGEIWARGHCTMLGYYKNPEATAQTLDEEGWVHTGDLAIRRPDGSFKITGRLKDMVIRGGENIYPREIEEFLFTHPAISQATVFGVPDAKYGEELCAWVQLHHGKSLTAEEVRAYCKQNLAHYKAPRYVEFVSEFPTTVSGKIQKFKMREQMCQELKLTEQETA